MRRKRQSASLFELLKSGSQEVPTALSQRTQVIQNIVPEKPRAETGATAPAIPRVLPSEERSFLDPVVTPPIFARAPAASEPPPASVLPKLPEIASSGGVLGEQPPSFWIWINGIESIRRVTLGVAIAVSLILLCLAYQLGRLSGLPPEESNAHEFRAIMDPPAVVQEPQRPRAKENVERETRRAPPVETQKRGGMSHTVLICTVEKSVDSPDVVRLVEYLNDHRRSVGADAYAIGDKRRCQVVVGRFSNREEAQSVLAQVRNIEPRWGTDFARDAEVTLLEFPD